MGSEMCIRDRLYSVPGLAAGPQTCCVCAGALKLGLVQLRGFLTDYCREKYGLERPRPSPVCFFLVHGHCSGKFRWMGRSSSQRHAMQGRGFVLPHTIRSARSSMQRRVPALHGRTVPVPVRSCPQDCQLGHPGPIRSKSMARPSPLLPVCLVIAIFHLVRAPRHLSWRHVLSKPRYAELLAAALVGSADNPHVEPR